ncbi:hypothetical protein [Stenotrophomonas sp. Br8]|uniref:hypothetical protein n=1 Tax=Stenotrophomonas sp. Br8 TaxID=2759658 RepID=UPI001CC7E1A2|nr:hypothetical protein [Stenotrophomonas sp. Br8]
MPSAIAEEPYSSAWYGAGQLLFRRAEGWHRIALAEGLQDEGTWTLVLTLPPRACSWGCRDFRITDAWEYASSLQQDTFHFLWRLYAIAYAVRAYDDAAAEPTGLPDDIAVPAPLAKVSGVETLLPLMDSQVEGK